MASGSKKQTPRPPRPPLTNESDDDGDQELPSETTKQKRKMTKKPNTKPNNGAAADASDELKTEQEESQPPSFRCTESTRQALWDSENEAASEETKRRKKKTKTRSGNRDSTKQIDASRKSPRPKSPRDSTKQIDASRKSPRPKSPGQNARMKKRQLEKKSKHQRSEDIWISNSSNHSDDDDDVGRYGDSSTKIAKGRNQQVRRPETSPKRKQPRKPATAKSTIPPEETSSAESDLRRDLPYDPTEVFSRQLHYDVERGTKMEHDYDKNRYSYVMPETEKKRKEKRLSEGTSNKGSRHSKSTRKTIVMVDDEEDPSFRYSGRATMEMHSGHNNNNNNSNSNHQSRRSLFNSSYFYDLYREDFDGPSFRRTTMDLADTSLRDTKCCLVAAGMFFICSTVGISILLTKLLKSDEWG